ncbi:hypothetical protein SAMN05720470_10846 [Fibrobacter sp. UWOV1]|uniref:hypothetical protein n=1 Tax=Fibrobacter sp. UWOV1 TaxID=1896215 RepID=UPI00092058C1|nr:hypothetical protein [Fibrobacter sp. UWOV1]SHL42436.1 hypothetical protein SAMN05720470_10846 [Fibrobacter sp. UWOV1]
MSVKDPVKYTVDGRSYTTIPLTGRDSIRLDKMVTPIVFGLGSVSKKLSQGDIALLLCEKMGNLPEEKFEEIRRLTFRGTMFDGSDNEKSISLEGDECYNHFEGRLIDMYNVMVAAWEAHKLTPFRMLAGSSTEGTA